MAALERKFMSCWAHSGLGYEASSRSAAKNFEPRPVRGAVDFDALLNDVMAQTSKSRAYLAKN